MSYQVLARKWRPQAFDEVSGQEHVTTPLRNAIRSDRVPHALLLAGPRGVGKTTLARLLARCLNCDKGPTDEPCGTCPACREIAAGHSTDVQEIDAASRTSVDDVRELIEAVRYAPSPGKHRIYVVDEVHMLSTPAFNALLKTLEEPPPNTLFVFATTNPEKIPFTVLSRCQRYDLKRLPTAEIARRLGEIAKSEGVSISEHGLRAVAREGDGSMRDAMTLLDQIIAFGGDQVEDDRIAEILDRIDRRLLLRIARACIEGDAPEALAALGSADESGVEARRLGGEWLQLLRDLVVLRIAPDNEALVEGSDAERAELRELAEATDPTRLRRMFRALLKEQEDLTWAPQPFAVLEMAAVRMATLPAGEEVSALLSRLDELEKRLRGGGAGGGSGPAPATGGSRTGGGGGRRTAPAAPATAATTPAARAAPTDPTTRPEPVAAPEPGPEPPAAPARGVLPPNASPVAVFERLRGLIQAQDRGLAAALEGGRLTQASDDRLELEVPKRFAAQRLEARRDALAEIASGFLGRRVQIRVRDAEGGALAEGDRVAGEEQARRQRQAALDHPGVSAAMDVLSADIVEIRPLPDPGATP